MHFIIPKFSTKSLHKIPDNVKLCIWRSLGYRYTKIQQKIITKKKELVLETRKICTFITLKIYKLCLTKSRLSDIDSNTMCLEKLNRMSSMEGWYPTILI